VRPSVKPAFWVIFFSGLAVVLVICGAQAAQSGTAFLQTVGDQVSIITATQTSTPTTTPTATLTATPSSTPIEVVVEEPVINPAYAGMCDSYWYSYTNNRGYSAFLTLNVNDSAASANSGEWRPNLTKPGYYSIEAYIPTHLPIAWECPEKIIPYDTSDARYTIQHVNGRTIVTGTQKSYSDEWLHLGEFLFYDGTSGSVTLTDLNGEEKFTSTVSFSGLRFTWQRPPPASSFLPLISKQASFVITSTVSIQNAPAFDQCHLPTSAQMQTWWNYSPYRITNVYLGGGLLYHKCIVPDASWISAIRNQGWGIIPTWVGPQAPCSSYKLHMSSDPVIAYQQGQAEADAASLAAWQIGLTGSGMGGTILYYDMENFNPANWACRQAAQSFISGWTERLHYLGNRAGAYGGGCTSYVSDWADAIYPPDNLWVAAYISPARYRKNVSLFGITCLPDNLWVNHQRIRQYAAGHNETWGNVTFNIDSNIADAEVVTQTSKTATLVNTVSIPSTEYEIIDYSITPDSPEQNWLIVNGVLYRSITSVSRWQPAYVPPGSMSMRKISFLDKKKGWLIAASDDHNYSLFTTSDGGVAWSEITSLPIDAGWSPQSIQFTDTQNGWIAIKNLTRNNFSIGRVLRTFDGGISWQSLDLPIGEAIRFTTTDIGWIAGGVGGNEFFQTQDSGLTWHPVSLHLPEDTELNISLPYFYDPTCGILPVINLADDGTHLTLYTTHDSGETWELMNTYPDIPEGLTTVNFITPQIGWGTSNIGTCQTINDVKDCNIQTKLWRTQDGGLNWEEIEIP
jgi:photosystem II stability/assembly factor-like uncharacterized protein